MPVSHRLQSTVCLSSLAALALVSSLSGQDYGPPEDYYSSAEGLLGDSLKSALHEIIDGHIVQSYNNIALAFQEYDKDPENENNILLLYSGTSVPNDGLFTFWNREHTWPQSYGADAGPAYSDAHHLFPADPLTNEDRSNFAYDELASGTPLRNAPDSIRSSGLRLVEPRDADKGRIARALLYMDTRYDASNITGDFKLSDDPASWDNRMGKLTTLLEWNRQFPPDERERRKNHLIYSGIRVENSVIFQLNRNPFVDYPDLADAVYTGTDYLTWGAWRVREFSLAQLEDPAIVDPLVDPDLDRILNLMEFALQTDPEVVTTEDLPKVDRNGDVNFLEFSFIKEPEASHLSYSVEYATNPLSEDAWTEIPYTERDLLLADRGVYYYAGLQHAPADTSRPAYYRIVVSRDAPGTEPVEVVFDPAVHDAGGLHLFTYSEGYPEGWHLSDWFGFLKPADAPWFYHLEHKWIYADSLSEAAFWFYDSSLGWLFTGITYYPYLFSSTNGWLYYIKDSQSPQRWFYSPSSGQYILEPNLI
ncbi:MAG: endonuclease I family protein [Puniceicoccaceae bacterium]